MGYIKIIPLLMILALLQACNSVVESAGNQSATTGSGTTGNTTSAEINFQGSFSPVNEFYPTPINVVANISQPVNEQIIVPFTIGGSASGELPNQDFIVISPAGVTCSAGVCVGTLNFAPNQTSAAIQLSIVDDTLDEASQENIVISLNSPSSSKVTLGGASTIQIQINDNDTTPQIRFTQASFSGIEGGVANLAVELSDPIITPISVPYIITNINANASDYGIPQTGVLPISGVGIINIPIPLNADILHEASESFNFELVSVPGLVEVLGQSYTTVSIQDTNNITIGFSSASNSASELAIGGTSQNITLSLGGGVVADKNLTFSYLISGSASAGSSEDFLPLSGTVTFLAGTTSASIPLSFPAYNPSTDPFEGDENIILTLQPNPYTDRPNISIVGSSYTYTITESSPAPQVSFLSSVGTTNEMGTFALEYKTDRISKFPIVIPVSVGGTALVGVDHNLASNFNLIIPALTQVGTHSIGIVADTLYEADETVVLTMGTPVQVGSFSGSLGSPSVHTLTISNDDGPSKVSFQSAPLVFNESVGSIPLTVQLDKPSGVPITIPIDIMPTSTATLTDDYSFVPASQVITLIPNAASGVTPLSGVITIDIVQDNIDEPVETIQVNLGALTNATYGTLSTKSIQINDDDGPPQVNFQGGLASTLNEGAGPVDFNIILSAPSGHDVIVPIYYGGSAEVTDYECLNASLVVISCPSSITIPSMSTSYSLKIQAKTDGLYDPNDQLLLSLGTPTFAQSGASITHTIAIGDSDSEPYISFHMEDTSLTDTNGSTLVSYDDAKIEGDNPYTLRIISNPPAEQANTIHLVASGPGAGLADIGVDFQVNNLSVTMPPGATQTTVQVSIINDNLYEGGDESFTLTVDSTSLGCPGLGSCGAMSNLVSQTIIKDNEGQPVVQMDKSIASISESAGTAQFKVKLSHPTTEDIQVKLQVPKIVANYSQDNPGVVSACTNPATRLIATSGVMPPTVSTAPYIDVDPNAFTTASWISVGNFYEKVVTITAGQLNHTESFAINDDDIDECDEIFYMEIDGASGIISGDAVFGAAANLNHSLVINDNDVKVGFELASQTVEEGSEVSVKIKVQNVDDGNTASSNITIPYILSTSSTASASDYDNLATSGNINIAAGQTEATLLFDVLDDSLAEPEENLILQLSGSLSGAILSQSLHQVNIKLSDPIQVANGVDHTCVLYNSQVKCWGSDQYGQLGWSPGTFCNGAPTEHCWGSNSGENNPNTTPAVNLGTGFDPIMIKAGEYHTCALSSSGELKCWGWNHLGQVGINPSVDEVVGDNPVEMGDNLSPIIGDIVDFDLGPAHTCAIDSYGATYCWGSNISGQLGVDEPLCGSSFPNSQFSYDPLEAITSFLGGSATSISSGGGHHLQAYCAGATQTDSEYWDRVGVNCLLDDLGEVYCWGSNLIGHLGQNSNDAFIGDDITPMSTLVGAPLLFDGSAGAKFRRISVGSYHSCGVLDDTPNKVSCWGYNGDDTLSIVGVLGRSDTIAVGHGGCSGTTCYTDSNISSNNHKFNNSIDGTGSKEVTDLASGLRFNCALFKTPGSTFGNISCWGVNGSGQLARGNTATNIDVPAATNSMIQPAISISTSSGASHACAVVSHNQVECWGANTRGQLGDGNTTNQGTTTAALPIHTFN